MKVSGVCGAANLYRQSAMSFNLYFQALLSAALSQAEGVTPQQVPQQLLSLTHHCGKYRGGQGLAAPAGQFPDIFFF